MTTAEPKGGWPFAKVLREGGSPAFGDTERWERAMDEHYFPPEDDVPTPMSGEVHGRSEPGDLDFDSDRCIRGYD